MGIFGIYFTNFGYVTSFKLAPPAQVDLIFYLWPIMAVLISPIILKERFSSRVLLASFLGLSSVLIIIIGEEGTNLLSINPDYIKGYLMAFIGAISWALYNVLSRKVRQAPVEMMGVFFAGSSILSTISHVTSETFIMPTIEETGYIAIMGFTTFGIAYFAWDYGVKNGNFKLLKTGAYAVPLLSIGLLVIFGKAHPSIELAIATVLILIASIFAGTNLIPFLGESIAILKERITQEEGSDIGLGVLESKGEEFTRQLGERIKKRSILLKVVTVLLIMGPIIHISFRAFYHFYFDRAAPLYFSVGVSFAIILTIFAGFFLRYFSKYKRDLSIRSIQSEFFEITQKTLDLIHASQNKALEFMGPKDRKAYLAALILQDPDATEDAIGQSVYDLTESIALKEAATKIETYRKYGFHHQIEEVYHEIAEELRQAIHALKNISITAAIQLENRFNGRVPSINIGTPRSEGFIERILNASEENNYSFMTLDDAVEAFRFVLEILNDRKIHYLEPNFTFKKELFSKGQKHEKIRVKRQAEIIMRNNRLRAILDLLLDQPDGGIIHVETLPMRKVIELVHENLNQLLKTIQQKITLVTNNPSIQNFNQLKELLKVVLQAKELYQASRKHNQKIRKLTRDLFQTKVKDNTLNEVNWVFTKRQYKRKAIQISEKEISLSSSEKELVIQEIHDVIQGIYIKKYGRKFYFLTEEEGLDFDENYLKRIAADLFSILNEHLLLAQPKIQHAIESSNGMNLSALHYHWTLKRKVGWIATQSSAMVQDMKVLAYSLVHNLVKSYRLKLNENMISYLVKEYKADESYLETVSPPASKEEYGKPQDFELSFNFNDQIDELIQQALLTVKSTA
jgi:drug/metabolite transporter (DMT)-like permease